MQRMSIADEAAFAATAKMRGPVLSLFPIEVDAASPTSLGGSPRKGWGTGGFLGKIQNEDNEIKSIHCSFLLSLVSSFLADKHPPTEKTLDLSASGNHGPLTMAEGASELTRDRVLASDRSSSLKQQKFDPESRPI